MVPRGWLVSKLGEGIKLISGQHIKAIHCTENPEDTPYLTGPADFPDGAIKVAKYVATPKVLCQKGDILITVKGSVGSVIRADKCYCISRQLMAIRPTRWRADFVFYHVILNSTKYNAAAVGLIPGITRDDLLETKILVPPLSEQRKIAAILSTWDRAIEQTQKLMDAKTQLKKGLMQQLLTGKRWFGDFEKSNFSVRSLKEFLIPIERPVSKPNSPYLALGIRSHGKGTFKRVVEEPDKVMMDTLYEVKENDLIVNITFAWEGAIAIVSKSDEGALVSHRFPTFVFEYDEVIPEYFKHMILTKRFVRDLGLISPGGAGRNRVLSKKEFLKLRVRIPGIGEQRKIALVLGKLDFEIDSLKNFHDALERQKKGLMQQLLTGRIRVKVKNVDKPASKPSKRGVCSD
jgi:type I restriction enzyme S subunit